MTAIGWLQILVFFALVVAVTPPLGVYMYRVFEGERSRCRASSGPSSAPLSGSAASTRAQEQTWVRVHGRAARLQRLRRRS